MIEALPSHRLQITTTASCKGMQPGWLYEYISWVDVLESTSTCGLAWPLLYLYCMVTSRSQNLIMCLARSSIADAKMNDADAVGSLAGHLDNVPLAVPTCDWK